MTRDELLEVLEAEQARGVWDITPPIPREQCPWQDHLAELADRRATFQR